MLSKLSPKFFSLILVFFLCACSHSTLPVVTKEYSLDDLVQRYSETVEYYRQLIEDEPDNPAAKVKLARLYYTFNDYEKCAETLKGTKTLKGRMLLAKSLSRQKEYDYAIEIFEQIRPLPEDPEYLYLYGKVLEEKNLFPKALKIYGKVYGEYEFSARARIKKITTKVEKEIPPEIKEISRRAKDYLQSVEKEAAAILSVDEEYTIYPDNTALLTLHVVEKILKERGKSLAEVEIGYDSTYERVELDFARTITSDGKVIYAGKQNIRDVSRYLDYPLYSNSRAFIVSMPSVDIGSFIEYKINIFSSKLVNKEDISFVYRLRAKYPIFQSKLRLILPPEKYVNFKFFNEEYSEGLVLEPELDKQNDKKVYTWRMEKIAPIIPEYEMPSSSYVNPAISVSTFSSWDAVYGWWNSLYSDKLQINQDMKMLVKELTSDASDDKQKAKNIYEHISRNIRYVAIEYGDSGYEPHYAEEVFINRYGDCKDQAILLTALLRYAGLKSYPVLIPTQKVYPIEREFPSINFNHAICAVDIEGEMIFMDPTSETTPFGQLPLSDEDRPVMVFFDDGWDIIKTPLQKNNRVSYEMLIKINEEEDALIERKVVTDGLFASAYRWYLRYTHPDIIEDNIRKKMRKISSSSQLIDYEIKNADDLRALPVLVYRFNTKKFLNPAKDLRIIPVLDQLSLDHNLISKDQRDFPIDFEGLYTKEAEISIKLPSNLKVKYLPSPKILESPWFSLKIDYKSQDDKIDFREEFSIKERFVQQSDYREFKEYMQKALYILKEEIILEKVE
ncbi:MAG: DUF3857 domain-containing protein [Candidatus Omnitrophica bacterium]|nr:DUF3857 domain-containing protein [Candidatus Omnitrophota bacterium]MBD3269101.1 DUF3857 domain-containing protein [Candidatus Omnitrophota bacterium]